MAILIGTDEAGYGPNLGPLVITATVWQVPDELLQADLYEVLHGVVCRTPEEDGRRLPIADSKLLYKPGGGLETLERSVLASLRTTGVTIGSWREIWQALAAPSAESLDEFPWFTGFDEPAPLASDPPTIERLAERFADGLQRRGVRLLAIKSVAIFAPRFNQLVERFDSKGAALSHETLTLLQAVLVHFPGAPVIVQCDKHGGRNRYAAVLQAIFSDELVQVARESRQESVYRWGPPRQRVEVRFTAKGENFLPAALASMTSKYLRELAMLAFNRFWQGHLPKLRPTAGYPVDARRFKRDVAPVQHRLGIDDGLLWRNR